MYFLIYMLLYRYPSLGSDSLKKYCLSDDPCELIPLQDNIDVGKVMAVWLDYGSIHSVAGVIDFQERSISLILLVSLVESSVGWLYKVYFSVVQLIFSLNSNNKQLGWNGLLWAQSTNINPILIFLWTYNLIHVLSYLSQCLIQYNVFLAFL